MYAKICLGGDLHHRQKGPEQQKTDKIREAGRQVHSEVGVQRTVLHGFVQKFPSNGPFYVAGRREDHRHWENCQNH